MPILTPTLGLVTSPSSSPSSSPAACFPNNNSLTNNLFQKTLHCLSFPLNKRPFSLYNRASSSNKVSVSVSVYGSISGSNAETETSEQESDGTSNGALADSSPSPEAIRQARRSADWKAARAYHERGLIYDGRIEGFNGGGLLVRFYSLVGFLPFPQLSPSHSYKETQRNIREVAKGLVGSIIPMKVILADEGNRNLIFSEKEAVWSKFSKQVKIGDVFEGKVVSVEDYGAFVDLRFPDGLYHLTGLVHVSEVSWDLVQDVRDILNEGDEVRVKVINVDKEKSRITLSIKQLEDDPLLETLEKVIPQDDSASSDAFSMSHGSSIEPLPGLQTILDELLQENGINSVRINRQGFEKRVVSQDLQLWLSNAPPIDKKFILLARAGRQVQEIQLTTSLDQEGIKAALQRVLERIP